MNNSVRSGSYQLNVAYTTAHGIGREIGCDVHPVIFCPGSGPLYPLRKLIPAQAEKVHIEAVATGFVEEPQAVSIVETLERSL